MVHVAANARSEFTIFLPPEFIDLPMEEQDVDGLRSLAGAIAGRFGLEPDIEGDQGLAETTVMLASLGAAAAAGGSSYASAGVFRSPEIATRPVMVLVNCFSVPSRHTHPQNAITDLESQHRSASTATVELPAGRAVLVDSRSVSHASIGGEPVPITTHQLTAWIPGDGQIAAVAVSSNNAEDWPHIADFATGLFETFEWVT